MAKLVFDIETSALPLDQFDESQQEYLFQDALLLAESEQEPRRQEILRQFNLWPFTARVVCIAMLNVETGKGQVLFIDEDWDKSKGGDANDVEFVTCADEFELLSAFWDVAKHYNSIVTFNGRGFDVPFIYLRSALLKVPTTRKDWLGYRYQTEPHCDLLEQLTFYNVSGREGAARRFNLDFYCKAFGIASPKSDGVTGRDMNHLVAKKRWREIADYCLRDVRATLLLYKIWKERLAGIK